MLFNMTGFKLSHQMAGVAGFNVCVADMMASEEHIEELGAHFRGTLHVEATVQTEDGQSSW